MIHGFIIPTLESPEALRVRYIQRAQNQRIQYAKNHGVGANGHGKGHNGNGGEAGRLAQHAESEAHILYERFHECSTCRFAGFLLIADVTTELDTRTTLGFGARKTGALEIVSTMLNVGAKLLLHLGIHLRTLEESGDAEAKRVQEFHTSSVCE